MLNNKEIEQLRKNAIVHKMVFEEIKRILKPGLRASEVDKLAGRICKDADVFAGFRGVYGFPANICISINDVVVHGVPKASMIFKNGDVVKFDFGVKDKKYGVNTDSAFTVIIGDGPHDSKIEELLRTNKEALYKGIAVARPGNRVGDIGHAIQSHVEKNGFHIVRDLTGHGVGKLLHEKPYIYNYGSPGTGEILKEGMTLAIEPIVGFTTGKIHDKGGWEIYMKDGNVGSQFEHTILLTNGDAEIIV